MSTATLSRPGYRLAAPAATLAILAALLCAPCAWAADATGDLAATTLTSQSALRTQAYNTAYAYLDASGTLYRCDADANIDQTNWYPGTQGENEYYWTVPDEFELVRTLYISSASTSVPTKMSYGYTMSYGSTGTYSRTIASLKNLESVVFLTSPSSGASSVGKIEDSAFKGLDKLTTVKNLEKTQVYSIGANAFQNDSSLTGIAVPSTLELIGSRSFAGCTRLTSVSGLGSSSLLEIGSYAFQECRSLNAVAFPRSLKIIKNDAFYKCEALSQVTIPENVTEIGGSAFASCPRLMTVTCLGAIYPTIGSSLFSSTPITNEAYSSSAFIIVPRSALSSYRTASNWRTYAKRIVCKKSSQNMSAKGKTKKVKAKKLKKGSVTVKKAVKVSGAVGRLSYAKVSGNKKISVNPTSGSITVAKRLKKKTYKVQVRVNASGNDFYKAASAIAAVTIKVK